MFTLPPVHLAIVQPAGYVHALGFVDQARYLRHQFRRFGAEVTIAKNRLREDAVNVVFGAHLGFDPQALQRHACVFFNLEQLGEGGAAVRPDYLALLRRGAAADYDPANVAAWFNRPGDDPTDVPVVPFLHAPYLEHAADGTPPLALHERPIELLFFGSLNARRQALIERIEAAGTQVTLFDSPLYGAERDALIRQARAVLNCHFYDASRFEQVRVSHCLSLGTPVVSERRAGDVVPVAFEDAVTWFGEHTVDATFGANFGTPRFCDEAHAQLARWRRHDPMEAYADLLAFAAGYKRGHDAKRDAAPWQPTRVNLGSGKDYRPGWLNLDVIARAEPDLVLDLAQPVALPLEARTRFGGALRLAAGSLDVIHANNVLEHVPDLPQLMTNALALLKPGGRFEIEVPYEHAPTAWQDPTHVRALNENSWLYYTEWFWYLGWFEHRFEIAESSWLDAAVAPCQKPAAAFMRVVLRKIETSLRERTAARTLQADFGGLPDDLFDSGGLPDDLADAGGLPDDLADAGGLPDDLVDAGGLADDLAHAGHPSTKQGTALADSALTP